MMVFTSYNKEIKRKSVKKGLLPAVENVAEKIMGIQTVSSVGCIKLPGGRYTQTLEELYRVNFLGPQGWWPWQGMLNLGAFIVNREDWEVSGRVQNSVGEKYIQSILVGRRWWNYDCSKEVSNSGSYIPYIWSLPGKRVHTQKFEVDMTLYPNQGRLYILSLRHIVLHFWRR